MFKIRVEGFGLKESKQIADPEAVRRFAEGLKGDRQQKRET